jgi:hypothetical protein
MASLRTVYTAPTGAKVKRNVEWDEYIVVPAGGTINSSATYYTDDKQDAIDTANCMTLMATN